MVTEHTDPARAVAGAHVVVTVTSSADPLFPAAVVADDALICAVGATKSNRAEIEPELVARCAAVVCDDVTGSRTECGDLIRAAAAGRFDWSDAIELNALAAGPSPFPAGRRPRTVRDAGCRHPGRRRLRPRLRAARRRWRRTTTCTSGGHLMITSHRLSLEEAELAVDAALAKSAELGVASVVCVCDAAGWPIAVKRPDNGKPTSVEIAINKAFTAACHRRPTHTYTNAQPGQEAFGIMNMHQGRFSIFVGGWPIEVDGEVVGGIE